MAYGKPRGTTKGKPNTEPRGGRSELVRSQSPDPARPQNAATEDKGQTTSKRSERDKAAKGAPDPSTGPAYIRQRRYNLASRKK